MNDITIDELQSWVGRSQTVEDVISLSAIANMNVTLGREEGELGVGDMLPPSWQWLFFNRGAPPEMLGRDGHVSNSDFMPPMPLPRRMWAGNRIEITKPLTIGRTAKKVSTIEEITEKSGRSGRLIFLCERSDFTDDVGGALTDWRTVVYRGDPDGKEQKKSNPAPSDAIWSREISPDTVLLFRYSALTFNSHRIHYDRDYTTGVEGYPALLVHGPLTATLLMDLLRRELPAAEVGGINVRAMSPLFDNEPFSVNGSPSADGKSVKLWAATNSGELAMTIDVSLN